MWSELSQPLWLSLRVATAATAICFVIGTPLAYAMVRGRARLTMLIETLLLLPLVLPPTVVGYVLVVIFGSNGLVGGVLDAAGWPLLFTWRGAVLAAVAVSLPLMVLPAKAAFASVDRELEEMASVQGLGRWGTLWHVTLPLARRGLTAGLLLTFARSLGEFGATLMVAGNIPGRTTTLPLAIYTAYSIPGRFNQAAGPVIVLAAVALAVIVIQRRLLRFDQD